MIALSRYPSASWASDNVEHSDSDGPGFTIRRQARQTDRPNRVHKSYGLVVLLQLLPTPPRDDAVTFRYRPESAYLKRTHTSRIKQTCKRTILSLRDPPMLDGPPCVPGERATLEPDRIPKGSPKGLPFFRGLPVESASGFSCLIGWTTLRRR